MTDRSDRGGTDEGGLGPGTAGLARLLVTAPFYLTGLATMATSVAARGLVVGAVAGLLLGGVAAQAAAGPLPVGGYLVIGVLIGSLAFLGFVGRARRMLRARFRIQPAVLLLPARSPGTDAERRVGDVLARLARTVDLPAPEVRVLPTDEPACFTVDYPHSAPPAGVIEDTLGVELRRDTPRDGDDSLGPTPAAFADPVEADRVVVVSRGLVSTLSDDELEAVLAHELAHVRNGDLELVNRLLVPVGWAESALAAARGRARGRAVLAAVRGGAKLFTLAVTLPGIAVFTRGREFAADRGGAEISGKPAALASALERLDEEVDSPPVGDLRSAAAVNVVAPPLSGLPFSHPDTGRRTERLRAMAAAQEW